MHTFTEVTALLKSKQRGFYDQYEPAQRPGLKLVILEGEAFRKVIQAEAVTWMINMLVLTLPADAYIMDVDGQSLRLMPNFGDGTGTYKEQYCILIASKEWPASAPGSPIPRVKFEISARLVEA